MVLFDVRFVGRRHHPGLLSSNNQRAGALILNDSVPLALQPTVCALDMPIQHGLVRTIPRTFLFKARNHRLSASPSRVRSPASPIYAHINTSHRHGPARCRRCLVTDPLLQIPIPQLFTVSEAGVAVGSPHEHAASSVFWRSVSSVRIALAMVLFTSCLSVPVINPASAARTTSGPAHFST